MNVTKYGSITCTSLVLRVTINQSPPCLENACYEHRAKSPIRSLFPLELPEFQAVTQVFLEVFKVECFKLSKKGSIETVYFRD